MPCARSSTRRRNSRRLSKEGSMGRERSYQRRVSARLRGEIGMSDDQSLRALPRDTPDYHARQAAHLRALADKTTKPRTKDRLLGEAERHERLAGEELE